MPVKVSPRPQSVDMEIDKAETRLHIEIPKTQTKHYRNSQANLNLFQKQVKLFSTTNWDGM